jgi:hypothetical protein
MGESRVLWLYKGAHRMGARKGVRMETTSARAKLAGLAAEEGSPTVATAIERSEVEEALGLAGGPPELILEILRSADGEEQRVQLAVEWEKEDLEELLRRAEGTPLILRFDAQSIEAALQQEDVEGHGFREKAVILAAVAATATAVGSAQAKYPAEQAGASAGAAVEQVTRPDDAAGARTTPATTGAAAAADEYGMPRAMPSDYPADEYGMPRAMPTDYPAPEYGAPRAMPTDYPAPEYGAPRAMPTDYPAPEYGAPRAMPSDYPAGDTGGGFAVPAPSPGEATLITGGIALLIAGAAFAATRRRERITPA